MKSIFSAIKLVKNRALKKLASIYILFIFLSNRFLGNLSSFVLDDINGQTGQHT
jgi:membrane-anchored glycerophosphoryl diester phosphodiesterase (GDPDase)